MDDCTARHVLSYSVGVYLVVNAVRDARLLVDGPDCAFMRTQFIQGNHDYLSELISAAGYHNVVHTDLDPARVMFSREKELGQLLARLAGQAGCGLLMLTALPMAAVIGIDYRRLCRAAAAESGKQVVAVSGSSLQGDWLDGYRQALAELAANLELSDGKPSPEKVALVGLLFDRNEQDCLGNVRELKRLLSALGLQVVSIWPEGGDCRQLQAAGEAGVIVSLPYAREAARTLARRTGARLIETGLPFGLAATEDWLRQIADQLGLQQRAEPIIEQELAAVVPRLETVVPFLFSQRGFGFVGDPHLLAGFHQMMNLFGARLKFAVTTSFEYHAADYNFGKMEIPLLLEPRAEQLMKFLRRHLRDGNEIDCLVTNSTCLDAARPERHAVVEFGFPSYNAHALYDRPYLGFRGALAFVDGLANAMRLSRALKERAAPSPARRRRGKGKK